MTHTSTPVLASSSTDELATVQTVVKGIPESKVNAEALTLLESLKAEAVEKEITATSALKQVLALIPTISRIQFKHTAALVGINPLTARNTFDRFHA